MIYLDSSAIVKLIVAEPESEALTDALAGRDLVSSELALTEVGRAIGNVRVGRRAVEQRALVETLERTLAAFAFVPLDRGVLLAAAQLPPALLRSLDAIHVASALTVADDLDGFVTFDERQHHAAERAGLTLFDVSG